VALRVLACPVLFLLLAGDAALGSSAWAQVPSSSNPPLTFDLGRIRSGLSEAQELADAPKLTISDGRPVFFAQTDQKTGWFEKFTVGFNLRNGPVPGAGMTHQEFLNQVTPKELYGSGGISLREQLEWGLTGYAAVWAVKKLYKELSEAKTEWRRKQIREQIERELAALKGSGGG
jgi:hypothetical protein